MDAPDFPPELAETDTALRSILRHAEEPVPMEHMRRIRMTLAGEAARRDRVARRDWWVFPGILGVLSVGAVGPTEPVLMAITFAIGMAWTPVLVRLLGQSDGPGRSSA